MIRYQKSAVIASTMLLALLLAGVHSLAAEKEVVRYVRFQTGKTAAYGIVEGDRVRAKLGPGLEWRWQLASNGLTLMVVPEPGTLVLLGSGVLGLLLPAWRRRARGVLAA